MTDDALERARAVADRASHESVSVDILAGTGEFQTGFYLYDRPAVAHLDDGEQPHFAYFNEMKGIGVDSKRDTRSPDEGGATVVMLTDRRVLAAIGRRDGDQRLVVPYEVVTGADYSTGIMKHRIVVETADTDYHLWIDSSYDESDLREGVELLEERAGGRAGDRSSGPAETGTADASIAGQSGPRAGSDRPDAASDGGATGRSTPTAARSETAESGDDATDDPDPIDRLERLKELRDRGVVTDEEFQRKKRELLDQI